MTVLCPANPLPLIWRKCCCWRNGSICCWTENNSSLHCVQNREIHIYYLLGKGSHSEMGRMYSPLLSIGSYVIQQRELTRVFAGCFCIRSWCCWKACWGFWILRSVCFCCCCCCCRSLSCSGVRVLLVAACNWTAKTSNTNIQLWQQVLAKFTESNTYK